MGNGDRSQALDARTQQIMRTQASPVMDVPALRGGRTPTQGYPAEVISLQQTITILIERNEALRRQLSVQETLAREAASFIGIVRALCGLVETLHNSAENQDAYHRVQWPENRNEFRDSARALRDAMRENINFVSPLKVTHDVWYRAMESAADELLAEIRQAAHRQRVDALLQSDVHDQWKIQALRAVEMVVADSFELLALTHRQRAAADEIRVGLDHDDRNVIGAVRTALEHFATGAEHARMMMVRSYAQDRLLRYANDTRRSRQAADAVVRYLESAAHLDAAAMRSIRAAVSQPTRENLVRAEGVLRDGLHPGPQLTTALTVLSYVNLLMLLAEPPDPNTAGARRVAEVGEAAAEAGVATVIWLYRGATWVSRSRPAVAQTARTLGRVAALGEVAVSTVTAVLSLWEGYENITSGTDPDRVEALEVAGGVQMLAGTVLLYGLIFSCETANPIGVALTVVAAAIVYVHEQERAGRHYNHHLVEELISVVRAKAPERWPSRQFVARASMTTALDRLARAAREWAHWRLDFDSMNAPTMRDVMRSALRVFFRDLGFPRATIEHMI